MGGGGGGRSNFVVSCSVMIKFGVPIEFDKFNFEILCFWTDLAAIWQRGRILGADSESEMIFCMGGQYQADIGHFLQFCHQKS